MAIDKAVDSTQLNSDLTSVANAIRTKGGTSAQLAFPAGFVSAIDAIPTGGGSIPVASGTITPASDMASFSVQVDFEPVFFVLFCNPGDMAENNTWKVCSVQMLIPNDFLFGAITRVNSGNMQVQGALGGSYVYNNGTFTVSQFAGWRSLIAGITYTWYAVGSAS